MRDITPFRRRRQSLTPSEWIRDFLGRDLLDEFFDMGFLTGFGSGLAGMRADVKETDKEYIVEAELPGFDKDDIDIELFDDRLTISARRKEVVDEERADYIRRERRYGEVSRTFILEGVKEDGIKAEYKNGILRVVLPKVEEYTRRGRKINID